MSEAKDEARRQIFDLLKSSDQILNTRIGYSRYSRRSGDFARIENLLEALTIAQIATASAIIYATEAK